MMKTCSQCGSRIPQFAIRCRYCTGDPNQGTSFIAWGIGLYLGFLFLNWMFELVSDVFTWIGAHVGQILGGIIVLVAAKPLFDALWTLYENRGHEWDDWTKESSTRAKRIITLSVIAAVIGGLMVIYNPLSSGISGSDANGSGANMVQVTATSNLKVRAEPSDGKSVKVLGKISKGELVNGVWTKAKDGSDEKWLMVNGREAEGYIWGGGTEE